MDIRGMAANAFDSTMSYLAQPEVQEKIIETTQGVASKMLHSKAGAFC